MKAITLLLGYLAMWITNGQIPLHAQQGVWIQQGQDYPEAYFRSTDCADSLHCVACGYEFSFASVICRTTDGGIFWDTVFNDQSNHVKFALGLSKIVYPSSNLALVTADSGIVLRATDTGKTWTRVAAFPGSKNWAGYISICDTIHGIVSSTRNQIKPFKPDQLAITIDGGVSWREITNFRPPGDTVSSVISVSRPSPNTLLCVVLDTDEFLGRSIDTGKTWSWTRLDTLGTGFKRGNAVNRALFDFTDTLNGWMALYHLYRTRDGGAAWEEIPGQAPNFSSLSFRDTLHGIGGRSTGGIERTTDAGRTWRPDSTTTPDQYFVCYKRGTEGVGVTFSRGGFYRFTLTTSGVSADRKKPREHSGLRVEPDGNAWVRIFWTTERTTNGKLLLYNSLGMLILSVDAGSLEAGTHNWSVPVAGLPTGWYGLTLQTDQGRWITEFCLVR